MSAVVSTDPENCDASLLLGKPTCNCPSVVRGKVSLRLICFGAVADADSTDDDDVDDSRQEHHSRVVSAFMILKLNSNVAIFHSTTERNLLVLSKIFLWSKSTGDHRLSK